MVFGTENTLDVEERSGKGSGDGCRLQNNGTGGGGKKNLKRQVEPSSNGPVEPGKRPNSSSSPGPIWPRLPSNSNSSSQLSSHTLLCRRLDKSAFRGEWLRVSTAKPSSQFSVVVVSWTIALGLIGGWYQGNPSPPVLLVWRPYRLMEVGVL